MGDRGQLGRGERGRRGRALHAALDAGVTFIDTADVYGDGRSERLIARVLKERSGRQALCRDKSRPTPAAADGGGLQLRKFDRLVDRSLANLDVETLDLVQLHCPPTDLYYRPEAFDALDRS